jgi:hypothetical protein
VCRGFESLLRYQAKIKKNQQLGLTLPPSKGGLFMCDMVQHIPFIFQWVLLTTGDSAQHGCGMDRPIPKLKLACELTEDELAELLIKRADGKRGAIRAIKRAETKGKKGGPPGVTPRPGDPEALWHVYDLVQCGLGLRRGGARARRSCDRAVDLNPAGWNRHSGRARSQVTPKAAAAAGRPVSAKKRRLLLVDGIRAGITRSSCWYPGARRGKCLLCLPAGRAL